MGSQLVLDTSNFHRPHKPIRREEFLKQMEQVVPWDVIEKIVEPKYPKEGNGRQPYKLQQMIRIHCLQLWYNLSDPMMEEMLYDSRTMGEFAGIDFVNGKAPDETTIGNFRRLLEDHNLAKKIFKAINKHLLGQGIRMSKGTVVDATIINAPTSTKNKDKKRDDEMSSTKKGNQWYFGMKAHVGVDASSKMIHSIAVTSANEHDSTNVDKLVRKTDTSVFGDKAYVGTIDMIRTVAKNAKNMILYKAARNRELTKKQEYQNHVRSKTRAKVEHPFHIMKNIFGFKKVRYRGLEKNANRVFMTCGLINIYLSRTKLLRQAVVSCV